MSQGFCGFMVNEMSAKRIKEIIKLIKEKEHEIGSLYEELLHLKKEASITCPHCLKKTAVKEATMVVPYTYNYDDWERTGHLIFWCDKCESGTVTYSEHPDSKYNTLFELMDNHPSLFKERLSFCKSYGRSYLDANEIKRLRSEKR